MDCSAATVATGSAGGAWLKASTGRRPEKALRDNPELCIQKERKIINDNPEIDAKGWLRDGQDRQAFHDGLGETF